MGSSRKALAQRMADFADTEHDRIRHSPGPELVDHEIAHVLPVRVADVAMDAFVTDDRELVVLDGQIDQDAVPLGGSVHAEVGEDTAGAVERISSPTPPPMLHVTLEVHADLGGRARLRLADDARDGLEVLLAQKAADPARMSGHAYQPPLAPPPPN